MNSPYCHWDFYITILAIFHKENISSRWFYRWILPGAPVNALFFQLRFLETTEECQEQTHKTSSWNISFPNWIKDICPKSNCWTKEICLFLRQWNILNFSPIFNSLCPTFKRYRSGLSGYRIKLTNTKTKQTTGTTYWDMKQMSGLSKTELKKCLKRQVIRQFYYLWIVCFLLFNSYILNFLFSSVLCKYFPHSLVYSHF